MRLSILIAMTLALAGCARDAVQMAGAGSSLQHARKDQPTGYLVGSIGRIPVDFHSNQSFSLCQRDYGLIATLRYQVVFGGVETPQITEKDYVGESFALALPAGTYEICGAPPSDLAIPVTVEAGKLNYLGRYSRVVQKGRGYLGIPEGVAGYWVVSDSRAADLPYILQRDPTLAGLPVVSAIPPQDRLTGAPFAP